jgi:transcriptional regulator with XRE-family HTH domain
MLGQMIKQYRKKANLTQLQLARSLGYESTQFVSLFERGMSKVPVGTLGQLIVLIGLPEKKIVKYMLTEHKRSIESQISQGKSLQKNK